MRGSWYVEAGTRRWHWNKELTVVCPNAELASPAQVPAITRRRRQIEQAAAELGADPLKLAVLLTQRHRSGGGVRERVDGTYTGRCRHCGARLIRRGFRAWIDDAIAEHQMTDEEQVSFQLSRPLGGAPPRRAFGEPRYFDTKKEAQQWAHNGAKEHR